MKAAERLCMRKDDVVYAAATWDVHSHVRNQQRFVSSACRCATAPQPNHSAFTSQDAR